MTNHTIINNLATVSGIINPNFRKCPGNYSQGFYLMDLAVQRLSGRTDLIPTAVPEKLLHVMQFQAGRSIWITGRFTSYNYHDMDGSHLALSLLMDDYIFLGDNARNENAIFLDGYTARKPTLRTTPLGCTITDLTVAVNYPFSDSDYLPCICWNRTALEASLFPCGTHIHAWGKIQSREYLKKLNGQETVTKTAYEISIWKILRNYDIS